MRRECRERFPPPTLKETASQRSRNASRHVRYARAVMHVGITNPRFTLKLVSGKTAFPAHAQPANLRIWQEAHEWETGSNQTR